MKCKALEVQSMKIDLERAELKKKLAAINEPSGNDPTIHASNIAAVDKGSTAAPVHDSNDTVGMCQYPGCEYADTDLALDGCHMCEKVHVRRHLSMIAT